MFGDGWVTVNGKQNYDRKRDKHYAATSYVTCYAHGIDEELDQRVLQAFEAEFSCSPKRTKFGYRRTEIADVGRWFLEHGLIGGAKGKRVPEWMFSQPVRVRQAFVNGFVEADGHTAPKYGRITVGLCNRPLVEDLKLLVEGLGWKVSNIHTQVMTARAPHTKVDGVWFCHGISWTPRRKVETPFDLERVRSIIHVGRLPVFDVEVQGSGNFVAGGVVAHNTRWHDQDIVGMLMGDPHLRRKYCFLIQRVSYDFERIECEVLMNEDVGKFVKHRSELHKLFALSQAGAI
jgi:hypothetical protein